VICILPLARALFSNQNDLWKFLKTGITMGYALPSDLKNIENEATWDDRDNPKTLYGMLSRTVQNFPNHDAVSYQIFSGPKDKAETFSWKDLFDKTTQAANMFRGLGVQETDVVAYVLPNSNETLLSLLGGAIAGIVAPINPLLDVEQIAAILRETNAKVVVTLKAFPKTDVCQKTAEALALAPNVQTVLEVDLLRYLTAPKSWIVPLIRPKYNVQHSAKVIDFNQLLGEQKSTLDFEDIQKDRVAAYFHTGGTTGMPKVAQHKYSGLVYNGWLGARLIFSEEDNIICPLPLFHVFASHVIVMGAISSGAHVVFPTPQGYRGEGVFDNFWKLIERWKITFIITVPTAVSQLMQRPVDADVSTIKTAFSGSAPMPTELFRRFEEATGVEVIEGYGLTEATCLVSCNPPLGSKRIGSVGYQFPYTEVKIVKESNGKLNECAVDEVGEVCISNPGVFDGNTYTDQDKNKDLYYKKKYLRTGDLGRVDADEFLWITGRAKDLIIRGGHNIDPAIIEEALLGHDAVAFAGAIGQPDAHSGEIPCTYVELVDGADISEAALLEYAHNNIFEPGAKPKYVEVLDELPKTAVGKVFKPDLRKMAMTRVYNEAFEAKQMDAKVVSVEDDKKLGLTAKINGNASDEEIGAALQDFVGAWVKA
jgi:fatty-acyl-CoA synthase/long-chain acyl-CoA synthetase